jgi:sRNA-binding carbon storage regulator CsrA
MAACEQGYGGWSMPVFSAIVINGEITVRIIATNGQYRSSGDRGPKEIPVHRSEVFDRTQEQIAQPCAA